MKTKLFVMAILLFLSIAYGIATYNGIVTGKQIIWILVLILECLYLDYYFNIKEASRYETK